MISRGCCSLAGRAPAVHSPWQTTGDCPGISVTTAQLWTVRLVPVSPSTFPQSVLPFWRVFWTEDTGCSFSVTSRPPMLTLFSPTKIKYMEIDLNLSWKPFYQPGHLLLNQMFWQTSSRWEPGLNVTWVLHPVRRCTQTCPHRAQRHTARSHPKPTLQGWGIHSFSGWPVSVPHHLYRKEILL